jgi:hypothetical protein
MEQSYIHVKWMKESDLEEYSYRAKQKIRRYWGTKEKKRFLVSLLLHTTPKSNYDIAMVLWQD